MGFPVRRGCLSTGVAKWRSLRRSGSTCPTLDVDCRVVISAKPETAGRTEVFPFSQRLGHGRTALGAFLCGSTGFDEDERLTSVFGFVGRHEDERGPSCIGYSFGQPVILEHVTNSQFLESDPS
jgi:hypothetical protein